MAVETPRDPALERAAVREQANSLAAQYGLDNNTGDPAQAVADIQETTNAAAFTRRCSALRAPASSCSCHRRCGNTS